MNKSNLEPYFRGKRDILKMFPHTQHRGRKKKERHVYVDNKAPILLVAHIDTVQTPRLDRVNRGAGFDDRLGVYLGHKLARSHPHLFDLLLTDYEETGGSTARYFAPSHDYKLIAELDREGEDYVDYDLASNELRKVLKDCGLKHAEGLWSDICYMDHVKCNKFNLGLGTHHGHSKDSGFDMGVFDRQVKKFLDFAEMYRDTSWPDPEPTWTGGSRDWRKYSHVSYQDCCDVCLEPMSFSDLTYDRQRDRFLCPTCMEELSYDQNEHYFECESCGDPHTLDELAYDPFYQGFLCATCSYILHENDEELMMDER